MTARSHRVHFTTDRPDEAREMMDRTYAAADLRVIASRGTRWRLTIDQIIAGPIVSAEAHRPADLAFNLEGRDQVVVTSVFSGVAEQDHGQTDRCRRGEVYLGVHPGLRGEWRTHELYSHTLTLPATLLDEAAGSVNDHAGPGWSFSSLIPVSGGGSRWRRTLRIVDELLESPDAADSSLIVGPAARLLAATALTVFPNSAVSTDADRARDRHDGHAGTLRRALAFIDANPERDITLPDIARSACVTPRAVQLSFRRHLDTTPTAYLRQVRLQHAHAQLLDADGEDGLTVTRTAMDWGFASASRFAAHYRAAYGESPSVTLRR